jgi:protein-disulfide isomerase
MKFMCTIVIVSLLLVAPSSWGASTKEEVIELKEQVADMQKDLAEIKKLLEAGARGASPGEVAFKEQQVSIGLSPFKGEEKAIVTLVEFSDYQCPFCSRHYREVMPTLVSEYVDTGKLKYVMRENPIASIHPEATNASLAALCANNQGKYWEMHDQIFDNQADLNVDKLKGLAANISLDTSEFNSCLDSKKYEPWVNADLKSGADLGVRGTPGFVLGLTDPKDPDKAMMTVYIKGAQPLANFKSAIDSLLESASSD